MNRRQKCRNGMILAIVLVILVILTIVTVSLSRSARAHLALARRAMSSVSVKYLAWAGVVYAVEEIRKDSRDVESRSFDRIGLCGIAPDKTLTLKERFGRQNLKNGYFQIGYDEASFHVDGFSDEESKINLNGLTAENVGVLIQLLLMFGVDQDKAEMIAYSVLDWKDADGLLQNEQGAEDGYYMSLSPPYHVKNSFIESFDELLLIKGMDQDLLNQVRPYLTIYPLDGFLKVNLDTASLTVLKALGRSFTGGQTGADLEDADALAEKLVDDRAGGDGRLGTSDDRSMDWQSVDLNQKEQAIAEKLKMLQTTISDYLRVKVHAVENQRKMTSTVEAVIDRHDGTIVAWKRE